MPPKTELGISDLFRKGINLFNMFVRSNAPNRMAIIITKAQVLNAEESIFVLLYVFIVVEKIRILQCA